MPYQGNGTYGAPASTWNPAITNTAINSTDWIALLADLSTALSTAICKDGQTTPTANIPLGGFKLTSLGAGSALTDSANISNLQNQFGSYLTGVSGTNTILATASPTPAYAVGQRFTFIPAVTNTGAVTLNISSVGGGAVQWVGAALTGGELVAGRPVTVLVTAATPVFEIIAPTQFPDTRALVIGGTDATKKLRVEVDGLTTATTRVWTAGDQDITVGCTQAQIDAGTAVATVTADLNKVSLGTVSTTTGGTAITFSSLPSGIRWWSLDLAGLSLSGTDDLLLQLSQAATFATAAYVSTSNIQAGGGSNSANKTSTAGAILEFSSAAAVVSARLEGRLLNPATNLWTIRHSGIITSSGNVFHGFSTIALAGTLDGIRIKSTAADTIDLNTGVNISYLR